MIMIYQVYIKSRGSIMRDICICACMWKKKMSEDVIQPSIKKASDMSWTSSSYESWKTSSVSSRGSLSSVRESLPHENPHLYHFKEIFSATNGFLAPKYSASSSSSSSSSSGAWRCVIRGDDVIVFQRKLRRAIEESELRERLVVICKSHHSSLIKLRGASMSGSYIYLVYDYVKGASLADCLRNPNNPHFTVLSDWMSRIQIAADVAHGLDYIHNSTGLHRRFVHNHIKSSSVIVTPTPQSSRAKICHFGTAELCGEAECMKIEGTRGYMSPEFQATGRATQKSDVYALGVVVLEILSGEEALKYTRPHKGDIRRVSLIETAREAAEAGGGLGLRRWMDRRLKDSFPEEVALKLARLGLMCVEEDPDKRPDISWLTGRISKLYLDSQTWTDKMGPLPQDFTLSMAPR